MTTDYLNVLPLNLETADRVRARFNSDATAGLDPSDPRYPDLTVGQFYWDATQPGVLECTRLWGAMTEMIAAMFPATSWGSWLDIQGAGITLPRKDEVEATGEVLFDGAFGTLISAGSVVSTAVVDPSSSEEPITFTTDESVTLALTPGPANLNAAPDHASGTLPVGTYYYRVTGIINDGGTDKETVVSNEVIAVLATSPGRVVLTWDALGGTVDGYNVYRGDVTGGERLLANPGDVLTYTDDGSHTLVATTPPTNRAKITAETPGSNGNVPAGSIILLSSPVSGGSITSLTNEDPTSGGADVESDAQYQPRLIQAYSSPQGSGTQADYVRWALEEPDIGFAKVEAVWAGAGTVRVIITDRDNNPSSVETIQRLQTKLDPVPGQGEGLAPIGAIVTVATPASLNVDWSAVLVFDSGYSLDGSGGTTATEDEIVASVETYINGLAPGDDVILAQVIAAIVSVPGVLDTNTVHLNGSAANVAVGALQVAQAGSHTLS